MTAETTAPDGMPVEAPANSAALFAFGRSARRQHVGYSSCPYDTMGNGARWREGWRFEDGLIQSQEALASFERATLKENDMK